MPEKVSHTFGKDTYDSVNEWLRGSDGKGNMVGLKIVGYRCGAPDFKQDEEFEPCGARRACRSKLEVQVIKEEFEVGGEKRVDPSLGGGGLFGGVDRDT